MTFQDLEQAALYGAELAIIDLIDEYDSTPKCKKAATLARKKLTRLSLETERYETTGKTVLRPAIQRAGDIAFSNPVNSKNEGAIKQWIKEFLSLAFVIVAICGVAQFASAFNPLYDAPSYEHETR